MSHRSLSKSIHSVLCAAAAVAMAPYSAFGQTVLDEVLVTAQRREEASRDVPISVTSINAEQLATANVINLVDTAKLTPGLRFDSQGPGVQPTIRGVGTAITTSGGGPNVGIYVDGFFNSNTYVQDFQLLRVKDIQVLKGPQGTLFGRNTTGGAILVNTADPSAESSAEAEVSYGSFNALTAQAYGTFGIGDNIALDIEGLYRSGDGYFTNRINGDDTIGEYENWSLRTGLKIDVGDATSLLLRYTHAKKDDPTTQLVNAYVDDGGAGFLTYVSPAGRTIYGRSSSAGMPLVYQFASFVPGAGNPAVATKPGDIALNQPVSFDAESDIAQFTVKSDFGFAEFTSYTQYRTDDTPYYGDLDATAAPIFNILVDVSDDSFSQEFLLNSKGESALQWTAGLNYYQIEDTWRVDAALGGTPFVRFGGSSTNTVSYAAFFDATYQVAERWFLTAGARYSNDTVKDAYFTTNFTTVSYTGPNGETVPFTGAPGTNIKVKDLKDDTVTPRAVVRFKPSDESSLYASYTRGYKAGILNVGGLSQQPVKPEEIDAFEVGYKYDDRTLAIDTAAFYYDYRNLQVSSFQFGAAQIRNAAESEIYGLEAQVRYRTSSHLTVYGGGAYTRARYQSFPQAPYYTFCDPTVVNPANGMWCVAPSFGGLGPGSVNQILTDASGGQMQRSPEFTGNVGASYELNVGGGTLTLSGNLYYSSAFYFDPHQQFEQEGFELLSLRAQWTSANERVKLAVFGDNLTDQDYRTQVLANTLGVGSVWGAPATYGVTVGVKF